MQAPPHTRLLPVTQAPPARHAAPAAELLRQHLPRNAASQDKDDPRQCDAVCDAAWSSTFGLGWFEREKRCDDLPQCVAD
jgi:hypothetical protein